MNKLESKIQNLIYKSFNYKVNDSTLFIRAFTHKSNSKDNYERLEILGDSVLQLGITHLLYNTYPNYSEGEITVIRQNLVKSSSLSKLFLNYNLDEIFFLINSKDLHKNLYSDVFESLIGAIYLDSSFERVSEIMYDIFFPLLSMKLIKKDSKTILQEFLQSKGLALPVYTTTKSDNSNKKYLITCQICDLNIKQSIHSDKVKDGQQHLANLIYSKINA